MALDRVLCGRLMSGNLALDRVVTRNWPYVNYSAGLWLLRPVTKSCPAISLLMVMVVV